MSYQVYKKGLEELGLSQIDGAKLLGIDSRTSRRWAAPPEVKSSRGVPMTALMLLELRLQGWVSMDRLHEAQEIVQRRLRGYR